MILLFLGQAVAGPFLPAAPRPQTDKPCPVVTDATDVVVCARRDDRYRLRPVARRADEQTLPRAELHLRAATLAAEAEQAMLAGGQQSQRLMVRLKIPFGVEKRP